MAVPDPRDVGLDADLVREIRSRDATRRKVFARAMASGFGVIWVCWSIGLYVLWLRGGGAAHLALAILLGLIAAALGSIPLSMLTAIASTILLPRHARSGDLDRYDAAVGNVRPCDVCVLAMGDHAPKPRVSFCPRCDAWVCESCRRRYDLRAIAALKQRVLPSRPTL
jgi:hypothetical protein